MSNNKGKLFEGQIKKSCEKDGLIYINLPDSNKFGFGGETRFTPDNPFDCIVYDGDRLWLLELKTTQGSSMSFNQPPYQKGDGAKPMIKPHQVASLMKYSRYYNTVCGLLLDFQDRQTKKGAIEGGCIFVPIDKFVG